MLYDFDLIFGWVKDPLLKIYHAKKGEHLIQSNIQRLQREKLFSFEKKFTNPELINLVRNKIIRTKKWINLNFLKNQTKLFNWWKNKIILKYLQIEYKCIDEQLFDHFE